MVNEIGVEYFLRKKQSLCELVDYFLRFVILSRARKLNTTDSVRDLGVVYCGSLTFEEYIDDKWEDMAANRKCNLIPRAFQTRKIPILFRLFITHARPLLENCTSLWSPSSGEY